MSCTYDPRTLKGQPIGMFHCPECGEMVLAGMEHPDYSILNKEIKMDEKKILVVTSRVKDFVSRRDYRMGADAIEALSDEVERLITQAIKRCEANGRKTVKGQDI